MKDDGSEVTYLQVLKNKYFAVYNVTSFLSIFGSVLTSIALILLAFGDIGSIVNVSYYRLAGIIPTLVLGMVAGVYVDRFGKKKSYIYSSLGGALIVLIPIFWRDLHTIILVAVFLATFGLFKSSSHEAILPMILERREITTGNSVTRMVTAAGAIIAPTLAVMIINWYGFLFIFLIDSITSILDAVCLYFIPLEEDGGDEGDGFPSVIDDIKASIRHLRERSTVVFLFTSSFIILVFADGIGLYILEYTDVLFTTRIPYGYYRSAGMAGSFIGALVTGKFFQNLSYRYLICLSTAFFAFSFLGLSFLPFVSSFVLFGLTFGVGSAVAGISIDAGMQSLCEKEFLGRLTSLIHMITKGAGIIAIVFAVFMLSVFNPSKAMLISGVALIFISGGILVLKLKKERG